MHDQQKQIALQKNTVLRLLDVDKNREEIKITILSTLGEGANCIAYDVEYDGSVRGVLKECWPAKLTADISRENFAPKLANENLKEVFIDSLVKFESDYRDNVTFLKKNEEITNYVPQHVGLFRNPEFVEGQSGTLYSLYQKDRGDSLSKDPPKSAHEVFGIAKSAAKGLALFHKKGRVYLDFKAANLFKFPSEEDNCQVKFFDADASVDIDTLYDDEDFTFFSTMDWEAPEMIKVRNAIEEGKDALKFRKNIDERTDFYLVGLLVDKLLNTGFQACQNNPNSWEYNSSNNMLQNLDSRIRRKLQAFFEQTIAPARNKRYDTDQKLIDALDDLYKTAIDDGPRINNHDHTLKPSKLEHEFVGRDAELAKMKAILDNADNTTIFLWGLGGIGKSELALQYANRYKKDYDCVVSVFYQNDLATCLMDGNIIANFSYADNKTDQPKFADFYDKLQGLCQTTKVLLIIDNFDTSHDPHFDKLHEPCDILKLNCDKIFTTRHDYREKFPSCVIEIDTIRDVEGKLDFEALKQIFYYNGPVKYKEALLNNRQIDPAEDEVIKQLIEKVDGHILTIELLALQLRHSHTIGLSEAFEQLKKSIKGNYTVQFEHRMSKAKNPKETSYEHLSATFNIFKEDINEESRNLLKVLTYIPPRGIEILTLLMRCGFSGDNGAENLNEMIERGWIKENKHASIVSLHPVISEVLWFELKPSLEDQLVWTYIAHSFIPWSSVDKDTEPLLDNAWHNKRSEYTVPFGRFEYEYQYSRGISKFEFGERLEFLEKRINERTKRAFLTLINIGVHYYHAKRMQPFYEKMNSPLFVAECFLKALEIGKQLGLPEDSLEFINIHDAISAVYFNEQNYTEAQKHAFEALSLLKKKGSKYNPVLSSVCKSAISANIILGKYEEALKYATELLRACKKAKDYKSWVEAHEFCARIFTGLGQNNKKLSHQLLAQKIEMKYVAVNFNNNFKPFWFEKYAVIAYHYEGSHQYEKAIIEYKFIQRVWGWRYHRKTDMQFNEEIFGCYSKLGEFDKALEHWRKYQADYMEEGTTSAFLRISYIYAVIPLQVLDDFGILFASIPDECRKAAKTLFSEMLSLVKSKFDEDESFIKSLKLEIHEGTKDKDIWQDNLSIKEISERRYSEISKLYHSLHRLKTLCKSMSSLHMLSGQYEESLKYIYKALEVEEETAELQRERNELNKQDEKLHEDFSNISIRSNRLEQASFLSLVGEVFSQAGKFREREEAMDSRKEKLATSYFETALKHRLEALKIDSERLTKEEGNLTLAKKYFDIGSSLNELKRFDEALVHNQKALEIREKVLPQNHPDLMYSYYNMEATYAGLKQFDKAKSYYKRALKISKKLTSRESSGMLSWFKAVFWFRFKKYDKALRNFLAVLESDEILEVLEKFPRAKPELDKMMNYCCHQLDPR